MEEKKKAVSTTANLLNNRSKDSKSSRIKQQIRKLFLDGGKYTSKDLNTLTGGMIAGKSYPTLEKKVGTLKTFVKTIIENCIG